MPSSSNAGSMFLLDSKETSPKRQDPSSPKMAGGEKAKPKTTMAKKPKEKVAKAKPKKSYLDQFRAETAKAKKARDQALKTMVVRTSKK